MASALSPQRCATSAGRLGTSGKRDAPPVSCENTPWANRRGPPTRSGSPVAITAWAGVPSRQVCASIKEHNTRVHFPIECRFVKGDDIWLSPAYQRDSAYIAIHMYKGMPYTAYFRQIEAIYQNYQGRPHWGKMHTLDHHTLARLYPRWNDFLRVRQQLDPRGTFLNAYLRDLLGVEASAPIAEGQV